MRFRQIALGLLGLLATRPAGAQPLAVDILGQYVNEDLRRPAFNQIGPNGGPSSRGFRFWPRKTGTRLFMEMFVDSLAVDAVGGLLFVPDTANHRVLAFAVQPDGSFKNREAAFVLGKPDFSSTIPDSQAREDSPRLVYPLPVASPRSLYGPTSVAYDPARHRLFVADTRASRVLMYDLSTAPTSGMAASAVLGQASFDTQGPNRGGAISARGLSEPRGIAFDSTRNILWVSDTGNNRILAFDLSGGVDNGPAATHVIGQIDLTSGAANRGGPATASTLSLPKGLILDARGDRLVAADVANNRVLLFDLKADGLDSPAARAVAGQVDFTSVAANKGQPAADSQTLYRPHGVLLDASDRRLFVSDSGNDRVMVYDFTDGLTNGEAAIAGLGGPGLTEPAADNFYLPLAPATATSLNHPTGLGLVGNRLIVADMKNNRVLAYDAGALQIRATAPDVLGQYTEGRLDQPSLVQQGANDGPTSFEVDLSDGVSGVGIDPDHHRLAICDGLNGRVLVFELDKKNRLQHRTADFVLGTPDFHTIGGPFPLSAVTMIRPQRAVFDEQGRLFVADDQASRVLVFDLTKDLRTGMAASWVIGQPTFAPGEAAVGRSRVWRPRGLGYDRTRKWLFVGDTGNNRVLIFDLAAGISNGMPAMGVIGQNDFDQRQANGGGPVSASGLWFPRDSVVDPETALLFVADTFNARVMVFDLGAGYRPGMAAKYVLGQPDFSSNEPGFAPDRMASVGSLALDTRRRLLYVPYAGGSRLLVFDLSRGLRARTAAVGVLGQKDFTSNEPLAGRRFAVGANIAVDPSQGTIFAMDPMNDEHQILVLSPRFEFSRALPPATSGAAYEANAGVGGIGPLGFFLSSGALPAGLTMSPTSGVITGIPGDRTCARHAFKVEVTDGLGNRQQRGFIINVR